MGPAGVTEESQGEVRDSRKPGEELTLRRKGCTVGPAGEGRKGPSMPWVSCLGGCWEQKPG